jgi:hypothetical protein
VTADAPRRRLSARAEKAIRLATAGAIAAPFGLIGVYTDTEALGYVAGGILLGAILLGPVIERLRS